jgi:hypothetical protein
MFKPVTATPELISLKAQTNPICQQNRILI